LLGEAALCGVILLCLFRLRHRIGLAPLYLVVGMLQFLQFVLATGIRISFAPGVSLSPSSTVLFPLTPFVVLLAYVEQDAIAARSLAYGIVICNLALYAVATLTGQHLYLPDVRHAVDLPVTLLVVPWRVIVASSVALFADVVATIVLFETVGRVTGALFARLWISSAAVMLLDSLVFTTLAFAGHASYWTLLVSGLAGKVAGTTFYSALMTAYVRLFEPPQPAAAGEAPRDVFAWLTYRQRYEEVRTLMARDAMTGVYNRGYFDEMAPRQLAHAERAGHQMSLVVIDVDHLKGTNDRHGHQAGDELVRFVGAELLAMVRTADAACRYGGDEFVVVLTTADAASARIFADRLLDNVHRHSAALSPPAVWAPASITIGIATTPADGRTVAQLMHQADARMYEGKRQGGRRVIGPADLS
jgi:diguanylate cyclase (GGDEF)-like protein